VTPAAGIKKITMIYKNLAAISPPPQHTRRLQAKTGSSGNPPLNWRLLMCVKAQLNGRRRDIRPVKDPVPLIPRGSLPEQVEQEDLSGNWLTRFT